MFKRIQGFILNPEDRQNNINMSPEEMVAAGITLDSDRLLSLAFHASEPSEAMAELNKHKTLLIEKGFDESTVTLLVPKDRPTEPFGYSISKPTGITEASLQAFNTLLGA